MAATAVGCAFGGLGLFVRLSGRSNFSDFDQVWLASRALLHGVDPYRAVNLDRVRSRIQALDPSRVGFESNERHAGHGKVRVTCSVMVATVIVDELRACAGEAEARHDSDTLLACAQAVAEIFAEMDRETKRPPSTIRPAPN